MKTFSFKANHRKLLADMVTPVSIYLKFRDRFPNSILLESSDYHGDEDSYSFICMQPIATFKVDGKTLTEEFPGGLFTETEISRAVSVPERLEAFLQKFSFENPPKGAKGIGLYGYSAFDAISLFETIDLENEAPHGQEIPALRYSLYKYIIAINHFKNELSITECLYDGEESHLEEIESTLLHKSFGTFNFETKAAETSNLTDEEYVEMVRKGKYHCNRGDVFQIVLARQFQQGFLGDDFNVYRALRFVNPSPYLFYFDYGNYKLFGSSPEAQLVIEKGKAYINPIAGTFRRTGDDEADKKLAEELMLDPKENAEHVMLVDLARNDLSRNSSNVKVETYREVQYFSHVLHLCSKVSGELPKEANIIKVMGDSFPAGTLSGAPKYRALQLIDQYENQKRGFYGGCLGFLGLDNTLNQAIMIRSFLSKNNTLFYQAGAGIVSKSDEQKELQEVNNKLAALKKAITIAEEI